MKRLFISSLFLTAALALGACTGTSQATVLPGGPSEESTTGGAGIGVASPIPNTGGTGSDVLSPVPNFGGTSVGMPSSVPDTGGTGIGISSPVPGTSGQSVDITSLPAINTALPQGVNPGGTGAQGNNQILSTLSPSLGGASTGGTAIPDTGLYVTTVQPPTGGALATEIPPESLRSGSFATSQAYLVTPGASGAGPSSAGVPVTGNTPAPSTGAQPGLDDMFLRLQSLMNYPLMDTSGASLGSAVDFVVSIPRARVDFLVVEAEGRQVLVPWALISSVGGASNSFVFRSDAARLKAAPAFDRSTADFNQENWDEGVLNYWLSGGNQAAGPSGTGSATVTPDKSGSGTYSILFGRLLSLRVATSNLANGVPSTGSTGTPNPQNSVVIGTVQDAIVNRVSGDMPYLLVAVDASALGLQNRFIPIPFNMLRRNITDNILYLNIDPNMLNGAPNFDPSKLPSNLGLGWDNGILNFWTGGILRNSPTTQP